jgi:chromosomal replication initiator protein
VAERVARRPESVVAQIDAETFAALCAEAMTRPDAWRELRGRFRTLDLFVLEDVQGLERAPLALEELSHTLDALAERGGDVAVSATMPAGAWPMGAWPSRLVNRLVGGLSTRIDPPGEASRRRYLLEQARSRGLAVSAEAVDALAAKASGYRDLDGFLNRLALDARVGRKAIDGGLAADLLDTEGAAAGEVTVETIARAVAARFGVRVNDLRSASRRAALVEPRHIAMHLARTWTKLSFARIGDYFGKRDPKTVRHACQAAEEKLRADPSLAALAETIAGGWRKG